MKRLNIIGALPESSFIGGVTIHVQRLLQNLDSRGIQYEFCDYKAIGVPRACLFILRHRGCTHIHVTNPILLLVFVICCKLSFSRCIFTLHANYGRFTDIKKLFLTVALHLSDVPVLINERTYEVYKKSNRNARYIPAFIPPLTEPPIPDDVKRIVAMCKENKRPIVSTNASKYAVDKDGNDIYGIDFLINFFSCQPDYTLLISDPKSAYSHRFPQATDNVVFINQPHSYFELLKHVDFFVRNTSTDGDALSVKEALSLGVPALCSDCVDRPAEVVLFKYSDQLSFKQALEKVRKQEPATHRVQQTSSVVEELVSLYRFWQGPICSRASSDLPQG